jgi:RNA polymerase sigma factor (sigma-70 family)
MRRIKALSERSDAYLIRQVKQKASNEAFLEICRRYEDLFYKVCQKYAASLSACGIFLQDIFNEKNVIILHCVKTFKPQKKTKLSSWIGNYARYLCLNSMNSKRLVIPYPDDEVQRRIEEKQVYQEYLHEEGRDPEEVKNQVFAALGELKDQRIRQIFELRYLQSKKMIWQKIAKKIGTSPQTVMALHRKGINLIRNKITEEENREQLVESI